MKNKKAIINYLENFIISKELFDIDIDKEDISILKRYYKDSHEKALRIVTDDEYVGITFDNLYKIKNLIKIYEKNG